jgi:hypothetical protein
MSANAQSLASLRQQARASFRYWHIYLYLRLREVEQHLRPSERHSTPHAPAELELLWAYGLWAEDDTMPDPTPLPALALPTAERYSFRVGVSLGQRGFLPAFVSLDAVALQGAQVLRLELVRVRLEDADTLALAGALFNRMASEFSFAVAMASARLWAHLHGARALQWGAVASQHLAQFAPEVPLPEVTPTTTSAPLPARKRGKGVFRDPR